MEEILQAVYDKLEVIEKRLLFENKKTMTITEYAVHSGIGENKLRELVASKKIDFPHFKVGCKVLINVRMADEFIDQLSISQSEI